MAGQRVHVFSEPHISTAFWLAQLRWIAIGGQLLVIGYVWLVLKLELPVTGLFTLVTATAASNVALAWWANRLKRSARFVGTEGPTETQSNAFLYEDDTIGSKAIGLLLVFDVTVLTALLFLSGGAANPFIFFYFANIAIAGMILPRATAWVISLVSILGCIVLLNRATTLDVFSQSPLSHLAEWGVTKYAFLVAFTTCCCVVTYFISMLAMELRQREVQLADVEKERARSQRLEALATLAAGAGHELASPLSTIAVVTKELSRNLEKIDTPPSVRRDVDLIREELTRCKEILHRMKSGAGEAAAENLHAISIGELVLETITAMREPQRVDIKLQPADQDKKGLFPKQALSQAIRNLLQNGLDASPDQQHIEFRIEVVPKGWQFTIEDHGSGMTQEVQRRVGEPFFTTKEVGQGMGLGVFLTRNVIRGLGGEIIFEANPTSGTTCRVSLPVPK